MANTFTFEGFLLVVGPRNVNHKDLRSDIKLLLVLYFKMSNWGSWYENEMLAEVMPNALETRDVCLRLET